MCQSHTHLFLRLLEMACKSSSIYDRTTTGTTWRGCCSAQATSKPCSSLPGMGGHRATFSLGVTWSDSEMIQGALGWFMLVKHCHTRRSFVISSSQISLWLLAFSEWDEQEVVPNLLYSNGAVLSVVASGVFQWGGNHLGLYSCWGASPKSSVDDPC